VVRFIDEQMAAQRRHCLLRLWFALSGDAGGRNDDMRLFEHHRLRLPFWACA
jgi:hypothetical protein